MKIKIIAQVLYFFKENKLISDDITNYVLESSDLEIK